MAGKKNELGPTGETVRSNVKQLRERQRLSYAELSRKLDELGRPIATLGLSRIEKGERRVDSDDLTALAAALEVSPIALLMPETEAEDEAVSLTGQAGRAVHIFQWLSGNALPGDALGDHRRQFAFMIASRPKWAVPESFTRGMRESEQAISNGDS